jgi:hypothetical protein
MPTVGGKHFAYTKAGYKAARTAAKRLGKKIKTGKRAGKKKK